MVDLGMTSDNAVTKNNPQEVSAYTEYFYILLINLSSFQKHTRAFRILGVIGNLKPIHYNLPCNAV